MFYIYDKEYVIDTVENFEALIWYYRSRNKYHYRYRYLAEENNVFELNSFLALTKVHFYDKFSYPVDESKSPYSLKYAIKDNTRRYYVLDECGRFFNMWAYKDLIFTVLQPKSFEYGHLCEDGYRHKTYYKFRAEPVPGIRKYKGGPCQTNARHIQEKRKFFDCEDKQLIRGKRRLRQLHDPWDENNHRCLQRNWKSQSKKKKQHGYDAKEIRKFKRSFIDYDEYEYEE